MKPVLVVEIVTALVASACLIALVVSWLAGLLRRGGDKSTKVPGWHAPAGIVLCAAAAIHGVAAMVYSSGAPAITYVLGWLAVCAFVASGASMAAPVRRSLGKTARGWHLGLMALGIALVVLHAVAGRM